MNFLANWQTLTCHGPLPFSGIGADGGYPTVVATIKVRTLVDTGAGSSALNASDFRQDQKSTRGAISRHVPDFVPPERHINTLLQLDVFGAGCRI
jgi:hypothetical protein